MFENGSGTTDVLREHKKRRGEERHQIEAAWASNDCESR